MSTPVCGCVSCVSSFNDRIIVDDVSAAMQARRLAKVQNVRSAGMLTSSAQTA
jgi:hypothetical protein